MMAPDDGAGLLPAGFETLERFVGDWGDLSDHNARYRLRQRSPFEQLQQFYSAMVPLLAPIFAHLDLFAYGELPEAERRLFNLTLGLAEAAQAIEIFGQPGVPRSPADHSVELSPIATVPLTRATENSLPGIDSQGALSTSRPRRVRGAELGLDRAGVPASDYLCQERFEIERDRVFKRAWLPILREEQLANPGDFVLTPIPTLGFKILIVRGDDGLVRAFHNSCAHRGVAIVCENVGNAKAFRCPYHAWVYSNDGKLRSLPAASEFPEVRKGEVGLPQIRCETWNGFVFINFAAEPDETLSDFLGEIGRRFVDLPLEMYSYAFDVSQNVDANWKHLANAFTEGYHLSILHQQTLKMVIDGDNLLTDYTGVRMMGRHSGYVTPSNKTWQPSAPVLQFAIACGADNIADEPRLADHPSLNLDHTENRITEAINIFPNTQIQVLYNGYLWYTYWPIGPDTMLWQARIFMSKPPATFRGEFAEAQYLAASRDVMTEDSGMCRSQQEGLRSGGLKEIRFGEHEFLLRHFAKELDEYMAV